MTKAWFYWVYLPAILIFSLHTANDTIALKQPPMGTKKKKTTKGKKHFTIIMAKKALLWWVKKPIDDVLGNKINYCSEYPFLNTQS